MLVSPLHTSMRMRVHAATPSTGCGTASPFSRGTRKGLSLISTVSRKFLIYTPSTATAEDALPLVLNFHGNPSNAAIHADYTEMDDTAEAHRFYVAYPEGLNEAFNAGGCCAEATADDLGLARDLVDYIATNACIDLDRVYATGFSNGGYMAYYLACQASDVFSAVASVGGLIGVDPKGSDCSPVRVPRVLHFHETGDPQVDYYGVLNDEWMSAEDLVRVFAEKQGCGTGLQVSYNRGNVVCRSHTNCPKGRNATLCTIDANTHSWPNGDSDDPSEVGTNDIRGNDEIWRFFSDTVDSGTGPEIPRPCSGFAWIFQLLLGWFLQLFGIFICSLE